MAHFPTAESILIKEDRQRAAHPSMAHHNAGEADEEIDLGEQDKRFRHTYESWMVVKKIQSMPVDIVISFEGTKNLSLLAKNDAFAVVSKRPLGEESADWVVIGRTEVIKQTLSPIFIESIKMEFKNTLDEALDLKVDLYHLKDPKSETDLDKQGLVGSWHGPLPELIKARGQWMQVSITDKKGKGAGRLTLQLDTIHVEEDPKDVTFTLTVADSSRYNPKGRKLYFTVSRMVRKNHWARVYLSESSAKRLVFDDVNISLRDLAAGDETRAMRLELHREAPVKVMGFDLFNRERLLGHMQMSIKSLRAVPEGKSLQWFDGGAGPVSGGVSIVLNQTVGKTYKLGLVINA
mmetsp:Transcript_19780/g.49179  ORF Transcript_19780/g.49179 Transcript_19780/m.49179 type:complete len:349 (+) Transcript_19780:103-1149(+)